ncbi:hypothetical protein D3C79_949110 [compost metagenome]
MVTAEFDYQVTHDKGSHGTDRPSQSRQADHEAASLGWRELGEQGGGNRIVRADRKTDYETQQDQLPGIGHKGTQTARDDEHGQI